MSSARWMSSLVIIGLSATAAVAESPQDALARAAEAYRESDSVAERLEYVVHLPDGREDRKSMEYALAGDRAFMVVYDQSGSQMFHTTAGDSRLRVSQFNVGGAYVESPYDGSLATALSAAGGDQVGISLPPGLAAFEAAEGAFLGSFGFNILPGLEPVSVETRDGATWIGLEAEAGRVDLEVDPESGRLRAMILQVGEGASAVKVDGLFRPIDVAADDPRWHLATDGRRPVADFATLEASVFPLGQVVADLEIPDLDGEIVSLASLRGRVVVLDFWATWCVPCWEALGHLEKVANWAEQSGLPVSVFAVDTLEQAGTFEEQSALAAGFLAERGHELPTLVDVDDSFFAGMHSPGLPSTVVIGPDGTLAHYHSGVSEEMESALKAEIEALLQP